MAALPRSIAPMKTEFAAMAGKKRKLALKREEWPRIRDTKKDGKSRYVLDLRPHVYGNGSRLYFETLERAKAQAVQLAIEHKNRGTESLNFSTALRMEAIECDAKLKPLGYTLRQATDHFLKWVHDQKRRSESRLFEDCITEYLAAREADVKSKELSPLSLREIRTRMSQFKAAWAGLPIMGITRPMVRQYLDSLQAAGMMPLSRVNVRANMSGFFNFCVRREWIDHSPCTGIKIKVPQNEVTIVTPEQAGALMAAATACKHARQMVPYFALCLFAGLRPFEARRLDWSRIRFEDGRIEILRDTTKTRRRRWAKVEGNGLAWLRLHAAKSGCIVGGISETTWRRAFDSVRVAAGMIPKPDAEGEQPPRQWDEDIMRHSFASYWLATYKNAPELAEIMGNSVPIIRKNYENAVLGDVAKQYWEILPA